jgi:hypothetical protein
MRFQAVFAIIIVSIGSAAASSTLAEELRAEIEEIHRIDAELASTSDAARARALRARVARLKQSAITHAIVVFDIDVGGVATGVIYSPHGAMRDREGATIVDRDGTVRVQVGDAAFRSAGWLGSTIAHEVEVHVNRQIAKGMCYQPSDRDGTLIQEVEAYDFELVNHQRFGIDAPDLRQLRQRRNFAYRALTWENRQQVDKGRYAKW